MSWIVNDSNSKLPPEEKTYKVKRIVEELFEVTAPNKATAKRHIENPYSVIVLKETVTQISK